MSTRNEIANDPMTSGGTLSGGSVWSQWGGDSVLDYDAGTDGGVCYPSQGDHLCGAFRASGSYTELQYSRVVMNQARVATAMEIYLCVRTTGATDGYYARIRNNNNELYRMNSGTPTLIGAFSATDYNWGANDEFILEVENNGSSQPVFKLFHKPSGGSESQVGSSVTDTGTAITGGTCGFALYSSGGDRWDNSVTLWSGGSLTAETPFNETSAITNVKVVSAQGSGVFGVLRYVTGTIIDEITKQPLANLSGLHAAFFDQADPYTLDAPVQQVDSLTTDASGIFQMNLPATTLSGGQNGLLILSDGVVTKTACFKMTVH